MFVNKEPQLYAVQKLRKIFAQIFTEKTFGSSINIYGFATTYNDASTHDGSGNRPKTSVLHATHRKNHFTFAFPKLFRHLWKNVTSAAACCRQFLKDGLKLSLKPALFTRSSEGGREEEVGCWWRKQGLRGFFCLVFNQLVANLLKNLSD